MPPGHGSLRQPPVGFAHRGASAVARANTLGAFRTAIALGATGLESDAWVTADGAVVLDHDGLVGRRPRRRSISSLDRTALPAHIPMLADLYSEVDGAADLELSLDVKDPAAFTAIVDVARAAGAESRLWLCHDSWETIAEWRSSTVARLVDSTRLKRMAEGPERRAATLADVGIDAVNMRDTDWSAGLVALFHRFDRYCLGWDAQHDRQLNALLGMGIDGVYSDHVDRMMTAIAARRPTGQEGPGRADYS